MKDELKLQRVLERFQQIDPAMPLSALQTYIWVATHDGYRQNDLERYLGASNATASRSIAWWGEWKSFKEKRKGPGFIESYPDPEDRRFRVVKLTKKGKAFWDSIWSGIADDPQKG